MPAWAGAFNMGNFAWASQNTTDPDWHIPHEAGHNQSLFIYGAIFHYVGAIHEAPLGAGTGAFAEVQAESNRSGGGIWG